MDPRQAPTPLRAARAAAGWTQQELAHRARLATGTISMVERTAYCTRPVAEKLAAALGIDPAVLLGGRP